MLYQLSRLVPVRFRSTYRVEIPETDVVEGGHGNHYRSEAHYDREHATWWQWRGRVMRQRTTRTCLS